MEIVLYIFLALIVGAITGYAVANGKRHGVAAKAEMLERQLGDAKAEYERSIATLKAEHKEEINNMSEAQKDRINELQSQYECRADKAKAETERVVAEMKADFKTRIETLETSYKEQLLQQMNAQKEQTKQQLDLMKEQFTTASEKELKTRSEELSAFNAEQLMKIIGPLNERIAQMKEAVDKNRQIQTEATARLDTAIIRTAEQAEKLGKSTDNLVNALSRDNKYQGSFGEMQLRQLLENLGFERGTQFEEQVTLRDDNGQAILHDATGSRMQPDVVLHFPGKRDIIIDAKTSMTAFLRYNDNSLPETDRQQALKDHVTAVKTQVKALSKKDYWRQYNQKGIKLNFVVMFIPSESAYKLATSEDPSLWRDAINQGVFITGPQNLYALLMLLEMSWKQVAQVENQKNIIDCANEIVKRVQIFYERFQKADESLKKTRKCFDEVNTSLSPAGQSIITSANKLISYGAKADTSRHKPLPREGEVLSIEAAPADNNSYTAGTVEDGADGIA